MIEYRLRSYNSESKMYIGRTVNQTVNKMVTEWSPMVTEWSPSDHRVITEWSPSGYQTVTKQSQVVIQCNNNSFPKMVIYAPFHQNIVKHNLQCQTNHTMPCHAIQNYAMQNNTMQYHAIPNHVYNTMLSNTITYNAILFNIMQQYTKPIVTM